MARKIFKIVIVKGGKVEITSGNHVQSNSSRVRKLKKNTSEITIISAKRATKSKASFTSVAGKSYHRMVEVKKEINEAIESGEDLNNIKGLKFVKPF